MLPESEVIFFLIQIDTNFFFQYHHKSKMAEG